MIAALQFVTILVMMHPGSLPAAQDAAPEPIRRARAVLVSTLDPALPAVPLETWLRQVVGPSARYEWGEGACAGLRQSSSLGVGVCGVVLAATSDLTVTVALRLGERRFDEKTDRWEPARLKDAFLDRGDESLPLERLGDLPRLLMLPSQQWPRRDVVVEKNGVHCSHDSAMTLGYVPCSLSISNPGQTMVYARVFTEHRPYADDDEDFVVKLLPGARRTIQLRLPSHPPEERKSVAVGVELASRTPYLRAGGMGELTLRLRSAAEVLDGLVAQPEDDQLPRDILMIRGALAGSARSFEVPVDRSVTRLTLSTELGQGVVATLFTPGGAPISGSDRNVRISTAYTFELGRSTVATRKVFSVTAPEAGVWRLELTASGAATARTFAVTARGISATSLKSFDLVVLQERVHGGYFHIRDAMPVVGARIAAQARMSDPSLNATFRLIDESGTILQTLDLKRDDHYAPCRSGGTSYCAISPVLRRHGGHRGWEGADPEAISRLVPTTTRQGFVLVRSYADFSGRGRHDQAVQVHGDEPRRRDGVVCSGRANARG